MYNGLLHAHSGLRWIALVLLLVAILNAFRSQASGKYEKKDKMLNLFAMVILHIQIVIGLALFFINERNRVQFSEDWISNASLRFYGLEHLVGMVIAVAIITLGRKKAESLRNTRDKHRRIMFSYLIGLLIILFSIPWPFREVSGAWF